MGDTANWEFAAAVASVTMGLGGLLLFTLIGTFGSWRVFDRALRAADEATKASLAVQDLARQHAMRDATPPPASPAMSQIESVRAQTDVLMKQQARLQEAMRTVEEIASRKDAGGDVTELTATVRRLEDNLAQMAATVANLAQRQT